jgi:hypothetical protein
VKNETDHEEPGLEGNFPGREKQGRDACVARVATEGHPDCAEQGLRSAMFFAAASIYGPTPDCKDSNL